MLACLLLKDHEATEPAEPKPVSLCSVSVVSHE